MKLSNKIIAAKKALEAMRPGYFVVWRSRKAHNAGQAARTKRYLAKLKGSDS